MKKCLRIVVQVLWVMFMLLVLSPVWAYYSHAACTRHDIALYAVPVVATILAAVTLIGVRHELKG